LPDTQLSTASDAISLHFQKKSAVMKVELEYLLLVTIERLLYGLLYSWEARFYLDSSSAKLPLDLRSPDQDPTKWEDRHSKSS